jgi:hypothetical protein
MPRLRIHADDLRPDQVAALAEHYDCFADALIAANNGLLVRLAGAPPEVLALANEWSRIVNAMVEASNGEVRRIIGADNDLTLQ